MKKGLVVLFVLGLAIGINISNFASTFVPSASVTIDGQTSNITLMEIPSLPGFFVGGAGINTVGVSVSVYVIMSNQGFLSYVLSVLAIKNSSELKFTCDVPITPPITTSNSVVADVSGYLTGFGLGSGVKMMPTGTSLQIAEANGVNLGIDVGPGISAGTRFTSYGSYNAGPKAGPLPVGEFNTLKTQVGFTLNKTGLVGAASVTGFVGIKGN